MGEGGERGRATDVAPFTFATGVAFPADPALARTEIDALRLLGFNVIAGDAPIALLEAHRIRPIANTWVYHPDPEEAGRRWDRFARTRLSRPDQDAAWRLKNAAYILISDEVKALSLDQFPPASLDGWFRAYLRDRGVAGSDLGTPLEQIEFPTADLSGDTLPVEAPLARRRLVYHAARFRQQWSARQLRHTSDLIRQTFPDARTEALPSSHGFFNAWGPPSIGMSFSLLDLFEVGKAQAVDLLAVEDWLGLNHMYGPAYTWSGAQSYAFLGAVTSAAIGERPMTLLALITPSDDEYLRLKAYSSLAQGAKEFFFFRYGPTYAGTENYWSDLRSEYDGIARLARALERASPVLFPARPVRDAVAILYSVSHDLWHADDPAAFVEMRLLWHALRHLGIQPRFVSEDDVAGGALADVRALYITAQTVARRAAAGIDGWVRDGGVVYLSAGAATRDEFYEPWLAPFAAAVWPDGAARAMVKERHRYNERVDLPTIPPLAHVRVGAAGGWDLPALGYRLDLASGIAPRDRLATFVARDANARPATAAALVGHGRGRVMALGFLPMLTYGQLAGFTPTTLDERWPEGPRTLIAEPLREANIEPAVQSSVPVVEASLLTGPAGSAIVLANYTYRPIDRLTLSVRVPHPVAGVTSTEGSAIDWRREGDSIVATLPLASTDIVLLPRPSRPIGASGG